VILPAPHTKPIAVEVEGLTVRHGSTVAVDNVSFTARSGRVTAIVGPNGAGKTSTIEVCEGFSRATSGSVRVLGLDPQKQRSQLNRRIGVMLQDGGIYPTARVGELIRHYCTLFGNQRSSTELLDLVGLNHVVDTTYRRLSGGEKQRLSLALALANYPEVVFLDEPTSGIDVHGRDLIRGIIQQLRDRGCCVIIATHELDEAERFADDIIVFHQSKIVASGTLDDLRAGHQEIRFRTNMSIEIASLAQHLGFNVRMVDRERYIIDGTSSPEVIVALTGWAKDHGVSIVDVAAGSRRLDDVFRQLTGGAQQ
jgi:ABC-2 type transport system ATP-binding protein